MNILFICTHNRCRSILSEAICNHLAKGKLTAYSAGSQPAGVVHPLSLKYLAEKGIEIDGLRSQSWDDFENDSLDAVITVCDSAANESCPVWFGNTIKAHWGLPDPSKLANDNPNADEEDIRAAFFDVMNTIEQRIIKLSQLNQQSLSQTTLNQIAKDTPHGTI